MNSISAASAIGRLLLGIGLVAGVTSHAADTVSVDPTILSGSAEVSKRPTSAQQSSEQCSVSHQGRYRSGRYGKPLRHYYDFDVSVTSNCTYDRIKCFVRYRTLVYEPYHAGSRTAKARAPWWESSLQTMTLEPGETTETSPLGPTRRNAGGYEIECTNVQNILAGAAAAGMSAYGRMQTFSTRALVA